MFVLRSTHRLALDRAEARRAKLQKDVDAVIAAWRQAQQRVRELEGELRALRADRPVRGARGRFTKREQVGAGQQAVRS